MANNSSDSSHAAASSDSDNDHPRTPSLAAVASRSRANTGRSSKAPSKIPKLRTASVSKVQAPVSPPRTPADRGTAPAALNWGSGGEWSALVGEIRRSGAEVESEVVEDDGLPVEVSGDAQDLPSESPVASSGLFDDFEHATTDLMRPFDSIQPKEVSDDDEPLIVFEDVDQQGGEGEEVEFHGGVFLERESSDSAASPTSDSEHFDTHKVYALKERFGADGGFNGVSDDEEFPVVSVLKDFEQRIVEQHGPHETAERETDLSNVNASQTSGLDPDMPPISDAEQSRDAGRLGTVGDDEQHADLPDSNDVDHHISEQPDLHEIAVQETERSDAGVPHTSDSDVSDMELPAAIIHGPFLNLMDTKPTAESRSTVSPEIVLRGLIRDAHPETIHFTLPHSSFSPNDLREGLQYSHSMLQAATSRLTMLEILDNETTSMTGADLRRWIALANNSNPSARAKSRLSVIFESLSIGEMKAALEELVQSRLVVEGEVEKTQMSLMRMAVAKERQEKSAVIPVKRAADFGKEGSSSINKRRVFEEDDETLYDAFLTAIMVLLIGVLYLCIRE